MPTTINGIGTGYWGKSEVEARRDVCDHCGKVGDQLSYDTRKYFVVLFLPVIPLGKLRVLDECPHCKRHGAVKLGEWRVAREEEVRRAVDEFFANPTDRELALEALGTCMAYRRGDEVPAVAAKIYRNFGDDAELVSNVAGALQYFGNFDQAETAYRKALQLEDTPDRRQALAWVLIRKGQPAEARSYLDHLFNSGNPEAIGWFIFLVQGFQAKGEHREALQLVQALEHNFPAAREDKATKKELAKLRKASEKHVRSGKPVATPLLAPEKKRGATDWGGRVAPLIAALILISFLLPLGFWIWDSATAYEVHLVGGLDRSYSVEIDGATYTVPPGQAAAIKLPRGQEFEVRVVEGGPDLEPVPFTVDVGFFASLTGDVTLVLNPDRLAVLLWAQARYSENPDPNEELPYEFHTGEAVYSWIGVDYEFEEFPDEIEIPSSSSSVLKEGLLVASSNDPAEGFYVLLGETGMEAGLEYLERAVRLMPGNRDVVHILAQFQEPEVFAELAVPYLEHRPVWVEWHRAYQESEARAERERQLVEQYDAWLGAEPDDARLNYLRSRLEIERGPREEFLERAMELDAEEPYPFSSLAYSRLATGRPEGTPELCARALELDPGNGSFHSVERDALYATRSYEVLLERIGARLKADPTDSEAVGEKVRLLTVLGRVEEAEAAVQDFVRRISDPTLSQWGDPQSWKHFLEVEKLRMAGDVDALREHLAAADWYRGGFYHALWSGDAAAAASVLEEEGDGDVAEHLLIFMVAQRTGARELAQKHLLTAAELLAPQGEEERLMAEALMVRPGPSLEGLAADPGVKALVLAAMTRIDPSRATSYRDLALRLNFRLGFPKVFLDNELEAR